MKKIFPIIAACGLSLCAVLPANAADSDYIDFFKAKETTYVYHTTDDHTDVITIMDENGKNFFFSAPITNDYVVTTEYLNVRVAPNISCKVYDVLPKGTKVYRIADGLLGWDVISVDGEIYYVYDKYVTTPVQEKSEKYQKEETTTATGIESDPEFVDMDDLYPDDKHPIRLGEIYRPDEFKSMGVLNYGGYRWTWYSERVLPGDGLDIPGRYTNKDGFVCDWQGLICLAADPATLPYGSIVMTPIGMYGKVYDCGCSVGTIDVYVNW